MGEVEGSAPLLLPEAWKMGIDVIVDIAVIVRDREKKPRHR